MGVRFACEAYLSRKWICVDSGAFLEGRSPCFESNDQGEARFVADQLFAEGVPATLQNVYYYRGAMPAGAYSLYPPRVVVRADDLSRARLWVEDYRLRRMTRETHRE